MSRLDERFQQLRGAGKKALIPYITAGDPDKQTTVPLMHALVAAGADVLELGIPFSDPMADGPVIQRASERALAQHTSIHDVLAMVREFRQQDHDTPVILMGYLNPVEVTGYGRFAALVAEAGADGVITVDLPPEESAELLQAFSAHQLAPIFLIAPTTPEQRIHFICEQAKGFVYYVSMKGVTGASHLDLGPVREKIALIRQHTSLPVGIGFGIKDAKIAAEASAIADAVVVGSAVVQRIEQNRTDQDAMIRDISAFIQSLRAGIDAAADKTDRFDVLP